MTHGSIIGYDINAKMCQISYYNEQTQEPETVDTGIEKENNQILRLIVVPNLFFGK